MAGVDIEELRDSVMLSVIYSMIVDEQLAPMSEGTRHEAREKVDEWLAEGAAMIEKKPSPKTDPATWGLLPEHQSGQSIAMKMIGSLTTGGAAGE